MRVGEEPGQARGSTEENGFFLIPGQMRSLPRRLTFMSPEPISVKMAERYAVGSLEQKIPTRTRESVAMRSSLFCGIK